MTDADPDPLTAVDTALDDPTLAHARAVKALRDAHHALTYPELARAIGRGDRQTRTVVGDLERRGLIERREGGRRDRFELADGA